LKGSLAISVGTRKGQPERCGHQLMALVALAAADLQ